MRTRVASLVFVAAAGACGRIGFDVARDGARGDDASAIDSAASDAIAAYATPMLIQENAGADGGPIMGIAVGFTTDVHANNLIIVGLNWATATPTPNLVAINDTFGDPFTTVLGPFDGDGSRSYLTVAPIGASGADTVSITLDANANVVDLRIHEFSGVSVVAMPDDDSSMSGSDSAPATVSGAPVTTTTPNDLVFSMVLCGVCEATTPDMNAQQFDGDVTELLIAATPGDYTPRAILTSGVGYAYTTVALHAALVP